MKYFLSTCLPVLKCTIYRYTLYNLCNKKENWKSKACIHKQTNKKYFICRSLISSTKKTPNMCTVAGLYLYFFLGKESDSFALCSYLSLHIFGGIYVALQLLLIDPGPNHVSCIHNFLFALYETETLEF